MKIARSKFMKKNANLLWAACVLLAMLIQIPIALAQTTNGWIHKDIPNGNNLKDLSFFNATTGWAVGEGKIYKTIDGGTNWAEVYDANEDSLFAIEFYGKDYGWAMGTTFLKTIDGGTTWTQVAIFVTPWVIDIDLYNSTLGWAVGFSKSIYKMTDGNTWQIIKEYSNNILFNYIKFNNSTLGWACGINMTVNPGKGFLIKTTDGGLTWTEIATPLHQVTDFYFANENEGYITGPRIGDLAWSIWKTINGGQDWIEITPTTWHERIQLEFINMNIGWAMGSVDFYYTTDGGVTWTIETFSNVNPLSRMQALDANTAYAVGDNGMILFTDNGGISDTSSSDNNNEDNDENEQNPNSIASYNSLMLLIIVFATSGIIYKRNFKTD
ncbi:MAG: WD40/YVTN/BNR-like repeat-containing protein [Promethearchaeota archaeon]